MRRNRKITVPGGAPSSDREVIDQVAPDRGELAGLIYDHGRAFIVNPAGFFPMILVDAAIGKLSVLIGLRPMNDAEKAFARRVFNNPDTPERDMLPLNRIRLTKLTNLRGTGITVPLTSGIILVNLGADQYADPLGATKRYPVPGQLLVHELVHAWQIEHAESVPLWALKGLGEHTLHALGLTDDPYRVPNGDDGSTWAAFGVEQEAKIVEDWYVAYHDRLEGAQAREDWRFRFIRDHIRRGRP